MVKRLLRWLARHEIAESCAGIVMENAMQAALHKIQLNTSFLAGYQKGAEDTFSAIEKQVCERLGGAQDLVTEADIAKAKKGIVH